MLESSAARAHLGDTEQLECLHRSGKALHRKLADERRLDLTLERDVCPLAQQYLSRGRRVIQPRGEVRHAPQSTVVVPSFETDPTERRVPEPGSSRGYFRRRG
jgi:hypothetical protein